MGTGKVAMIKYPVYILLDKLLENCSLDELSSLNLSEEEYLNAIEDISDAIENEYILSAVPMEKVTGNSVTK